MIRLNLGVAVIARRVTSLGDYLAQATARARVWRHKNGLFHVLRNIPIANDMSVHAPLLRMQAKLKRKSR